MRVERLQSFASGKPTISVVESTKGNQLGGSFALSFENETTAPLSFDVDTDTLEAALESVDGIGSVDVSTNGKIDSELGRMFTITFLDAGMGDVPLLRPDETHLTGLGAVISVTEHVKGSVASNAAIEISFVHPRSCSSSDVGRPFCGSHVTEDIVELSPRSDFGGMAHNSQYSPDYSVQVIRTMYTGEEPLYALGGYFNIEYDGSLSQPIHAHASADDVRLVLEDLPGIETVRVTRDFAYQSLPGVCIDVSIGSSSVKCSALCSPCNFGDRGIRANQLVKLGDKWQRVSSYYDGVAEYFDIASVDDSKVKTLFVGDNHLQDWNLQLWTGGYEWTVALLKVVGGISPRPLKSPKHHLLPRGAAIDIAPTDCNNCVRVSSISPGTEYYIRAKSKNDIGWSEYSDTITEIPRGIPSAPEQVRVTAVSGSCLEVAFEPPLYDFQISSYIIQWDDNVYFLNAESGSASCSSVGYGSCTISQSTSSTLPHRYEFCGLDANTTYFVRVSARNSVPVQSLHHPLGISTDNTHWSGHVSSAPSDQVPDPPLSLELIVIGPDSFQILFKWPRRDGGPAITDFAVIYDTSDQFSSSNTFTVAASVVSAVPDSGDKYVFDFDPIMPSLVAGEVHYIKLVAINSVGPGAESEVVSGIPSGPPDPPSSAFLGTLRSSEFPIETATVTWTAPASDGGYPINGYLVEWYTREKIPEVQIVRLTYSSQLIDTTFSLSFSPTPTIKRETPNLPWNASASLVRRELLNLGWDESNDLMLISDIDVTRIAIANGYQWSITFGGNPERANSDGDQVSLLGNVMPNGDTGSPTINISTLKDGQRQGGRNEVQYLQVIGDSSNAIGATGHYRVKFAGSEWSNYISIHANAGYIKNALEQLSTIREVDVLQHDDLDSSLAGGVDSDDLIHHYEIRFIGGGNVEALVVDSSHVIDSIVVVHDGSNVLNYMNTKASATIPGELPARYDNSGILDSSIESYEITGLQTGIEYFVAVSASNSAHGLSKRLIPVPASITPPLQAPESPQHVSLDVNTGFSRIWFGVLFECWVWILHNIPKHVLYSTPQI